MLEGDSPRILVSTPHSSSSLRLPGKKGSVQEVLRSKLNRIHAGLRKRRALSVQEVFSSPSHEQPTFYVPSPENDSNSGGDKVTASFIVNDCDIVSRKTNHEARQSRPRSRYENGGGVTQFVVNNDHGYHSYDSQGYDSLPFEPEPDYDDALNSKPVSSACPRRWSMADTFMMYKNFCRQPHLPPKDIDSGPTSITLENSPRLGNTTSNLENVNTKIPKAKLSSSGKTRERTRSHSPVKNKNTKEHAKSTTNVTKESSTRNCNSRVVTSKSYYRFVSPEQRPEVNPNADYGRMNKERKQVCDFKTLHDAT